MAGDFLTPTFIGLAFQDMVPFGHRSDRATMLEIALERRFAAITGLNGIDPKSRPCSSDLLNCPFLTLIPRPGLWVPLLVLNGLSVGTGQRLVTTSLEPTYIAARCAGLGSPAACRLFTDTFHFHDLLHEAAPGGDWKASLQRSLTADQLLGRKAVDVRLSTAALNSARFPIISPPGGIRNESNHMVDRVVDGGYFENYGVATAVELAKAMRAVEPAIAPFVLVISNDPGFPIDSQQMPENIQDTDFLTDATALFYSVLRARDARGKLGVAQLRSELREVEAACGSSSAHLRVWPQDASSSRPSCSKHSGTTRAVSMSWWLSTPIQLHLVEQIDGKDNCNKDAVSTLWQALEAPACGTKLLQINAILRDQLP